MIEVIAFDQEKQYVDDFLKLPSLIYAKSHLMQNIEEEKSLLLGEHVLSKYFKLNKFIVYEAHQLAGRFVITTYEKDDIAYLGFFECINDDACTKELFDYAKAFCKEKGYQKIVGPVDASFWLKYRLKTDQFDRLPYMGEPYNKDYYLKLFKDNQFTVCEEYLSNLYRKSPLFVKLKPQQKYYSRYTDFKKKNYKIISPKRKDWDTVLREVYQILMCTYIDFPIFKAIDEEDFVKHFSAYKNILDLSMIKIAYEKGKAVGFLIGMPDYKNTLYQKMKFYTLIKTLLKRVRTDNYVILYMGVLPEHTGLGKALVKPVMVNIYLKRAASVGALIRKGKLTSSYLDHFIEKRCSYVLLEYKIVK